MLDPLLRMGFQSLDSPDGILLDKSQELDINQTEGHSFRERTVMRYGKKDRHIVDGIDCHGFFSLYCTCTDGREDLGEDRHASEW